MCVCDARLRVGLPPYLAVSSNKHSANSSLMIIIIFSVFSFKGAAKGQEDPKESFIG